MTTERIQIADDEALRAPSFYWRDKKTGEPCPRRGNELCTITDSSHRHVAAHMWEHMLQFEIARLRAQRDEALAIAQESTRRHEGGHPANYTALMDIVRVLSRTEDGTNG